MATGCDGEWRFRMDCARSNNGTCSDGECVWATAQTCDTETFESGCFGSECDASHEPTCEGSSLVICNAGRLDRVDCKALGFTGCATARCAPSPWRQ